MKNNNFFKGNGKTLICYLTLTLKVIVTFFNSLKNMMMTIWKIIFFRENRTKNYQFFSGEGPSNASTNFNRQFFELVQKSDDENEKKNFFQGKWQNPNT